MSATDVLRSKAERAVGWFQNLANVALVVGAFAFMAYVLWSLDRLQESEIESKAFRSSLGPQLQRAGTVFRDQEQRIRDLESTVFYSLEPKLDEQAIEQKKRQPPRKIELWQRTRDEELRQLIKDLQKQVLEQRNEIYELKRQRPREQ